MHDAGPGGLGDMDVAVDAAGQDQQPRRVDLARGALERLGQRDDAAAADADVAARACRRP